MLSLCLKYGIEKNIPKEINNGCFYICIDTGSCFIDYNDKRTKLSAEYAEKLKYIATNQETIELNPEEIMRRPQIKELTINSSSWNTDINSYDKNYYGTFLSGGNDSTIKNTLMAWNVDASSYATASNIGLICIETQEDNEAIYKFYADAIPDEDIKIYYYIQSIA